MERRLRGVAIGVGVFIVALLIGSSLAAQTQGPVTVTIHWDSPRTEELARRTCFACHSNERAFPWYGFIPPINAMLREDILDGRDVFNFSTMEGLKGSKLVEGITDADMPPEKYRWLHPEANLTDSEREELIRGFYATFPG